MSLLSSGASVVLAPSTSIPRNSAILETPSRIAAARQLRRGSQCVNSGLRLSHFSRFKLAKSELRVRIFAVCNVESKFRSFINSGASAGDRWRLLEDEHFVAVRSVKSCAVVGCLNFWIVSQAFFSCILDFEGKMGESQQQNK